MQTECKKFNITGVVQGVGFRPFIYRFAKKYNLHGYVKNLGNNVEIVVEGRGKDIDEFLYDLTIHNPPLSSIGSIKTTVIRECGFTDFSILDSEKGSFANSIIPPDTAICSECMGEMFDPNNRRYHYPFTVCTNCGPRYTTVQALPYDRENTTMADFPLCPDCNREYTAQLDRRYHAQPVCCSHCGPGLLLMDGQGDVHAHREDAIAECAKLIDEGYIVAIKGYGGFHIACRADTDEAIFSLRERLNRPAQPFAVMAHNIGTVRMFARVSGQECDLLTNSRRPIVVVSKNDDFPLSGIVAPNLHNIGVMLPYSGTHHLLFDKSRSDVYVMTSANLPGRPMVIDNEEAFDKLEGIADYYLMHDRRIANRTDDTVVRIVNGHTAYLRRSRGFVPEPIELPFGIGAAIGVGAELNTTVTVAKGNLAYISQYVGNTKHVETSKYHNEVARHMMNLTGIDPQIWGCDLHPMFNTTAFALEHGEKEGYSVIPVQHHHAHIVSLMADNDLPVDSKIIGIALDGVGYGDDGTVWGGEILKATYSGYARVSHLMVQPMPGGDVAAYYPSRMVLGMLNGVLGQDELRRLSLYFKHGISERDAVLNQLEKGINVVQTSSAGRVLDGAAALLGIANRRSFEGEPAMKLESAAKQGADTVELPIVCKRGVLDTTQLLYGVYELLDTHQINDLAYAVENALAMGVAKLAISAAGKYGIDVVGLSGGVAYNDHITSCIHEYVKESGLELITHRNVPCGDGGISFGQAVTAGVRLRELLK